MTKEKQAIMDVLQAHVLKRTDLLSDFAREKIADEIMEAQREIWTRALDEVGIVLEDN